MTLVFITWARLSEGEKERFDLTLRRLWSSSQQQAKGIENVCDWCYVLCVDM
jgi:hypothetical protein